MQSNKYPSIINIPFHEKHSQDEHGEPPPDVLSDDRGLLGAGDGVVADLDLVRFGQRVRHSSGTSPRGARSLSRTSNRFTANGNWCPCPTRPDRCRSCPHWLKTNEPCGERATVSDGTSRQGNDGDRLLGGLRVQHDGAPGSAISSPAPSRMLPSAWMLFRIKSGKLMISKPGRVRGRFRP